MKDADLYSVLEHASALAEPLSVPIGALPSGFPLDGGGGGGHVVSIEGSSSSSNSSSSAAANKRAHHKETAHRASTGKAVKKRTWKKPADMPKRPLSAYNLFFQAERKKVVAAKTAADNDEDEWRPQTQGQQRHQGVFGGIADGAAAAGVCGNDGGTKRLHQRTHGKIGFAALAQNIAAKWKALDARSKSKFQRNAAVEKARYGREIAIWKAKRQERRSAEQGGEGDGPPEEEHEGTTATATEQERREQPQQPKRKRKSTKTKTAGTRRNPSSLSSETSEPMSMPSLQNFEPTPLPETMGGVSSLLPAAPTPSSSSSSSIDLDRILKASLMDFEPIRLASLVAAPQMFTNAGAQSVRLAAPARPAVIGPGRAQGVHFAAAPAAPGSFSPRTVEEDPMCERGAFRYHHSHQQQHQAQFQSPYPPAGVIPRFFTQQQQQLRQQALLPQHVRSCGGCSGAPAVANPHPGSGTMMAPPLALQPSPPLPPPPFKDLSSVRNPTSPIGTLDSLHQLDETDDNIDDDFLRFLSDFESEKC